MIQGNRVLQIMGEDNQLLQTVSLDRLESQLSNLNNYANRYKVTHTPGRKAQLDSKELSEGASAAGQTAYDSSVASTELIDGRYSRPGKHGGKEFINPDAERQKAVDAFMAKYGEVAPATRKELDTGHYRTQTPISYQNGAGFGFATGNLAGNKNTDTDRCALSGRKAGRWQRRR